MEEDIWSDETEQIVSEQAIEQTTTERKNERSASSAHRSSTANLLQAQTALMDNELISAQAHPELYRLLRMHVAELEEWHKQHTGWRVQRGSSFFRLERHTHMLVPLYTDEKLRKARDFACFTWLLWFAEKRFLAGGGRNQQFLLSQLIQELQEQTGLTGGNALDFRNQYDRYSMSRALDYLSRLGGIHTLEGETSKWVEVGYQQDNEVLYEFTVLTHSLVESLNQRQIDAVSSALASGQSNQSTSWNIPALADPIPPLTRAWRSLLLGPMLLRLDDPEAFAALQHDSELISDELAESFGWLLELNNDYACIVRGGSLSVGSGPDIVLSSGYNHIILLLCGAFRQQVEEGHWQPDSYGCIRVTSLDIAPLFTELRQRHGMNWGTTLQALKASELLDEIYQRMRQFGLLRGPLANDELLILPTAARYSANYDQEPAERPRPRSKSVRKPTSKSQLIFEWNNR
ncbi:TIGR02678 family protein [Tengunoibacter tsumagoiensis]|uniref:TIGR02678 family protein n=1 Tax=Tengunoibacter tsumagoiensis TaxID=2014871 RepID=A0A401ZV96_9CHLR|nr:TIGR02678 family protein [Tengunoibacter tsumagoiensis]GCE10821.1 hypothetical protein KTT_06800 [Tengunoibacter tsumagoiensis]